MGVETAGGDTPLAQNLVAFNAAMNARAVAKLAVPEGAKFSVDALKGSWAAGGGVNGLKATAARVTPIASALEAQSGAARLAQKIPVVGKYLTQLLGPDAIVNNAIGGLTQKAGGNWFQRTIPGVSKMFPPSALTVGTATPARITQIMMEGGDVAKKLIAAGVPADSAAMLAQKGAERAAAMGAQVATTEVATSVAGGVAKTVATSSVDDVVKQAMGFTMKKNFEQVTEAAVKKALADPNPIKALTKIGFYIDNARTLVADAGTSAAKGAVTEVAATTTTTAVKETAKKGFFRTLLSGAKGNFVVAGVFSLVGNTVSLCQGKMNLKQFVGLTALDTLAYGSIGWGSAAAGAAIGSFIPVPFVGTAVGFLVGLGIGIGAGMVYDKFLRSPIKTYTDSAPAGGAAPGSYDPSAYGNAPLTDPFAAGSQGAQPQGAQGPIGVLPNASGGIGRDEAMAEIERLAAFYENGGVKN